MEKKEVREIIENNFEVEGDLLDTVEYLRDLYEKYIALGYHDLKIGEVASDGDGYYSEYDTGYYIYGYRIETDKEFEKRKKKQKRDRERNKKEAVRFQEQKEKEIQKRIKELEKEGYIITKDD